MWRNVCSDKKRKRKRIAKAEVFRAQRKTVKVEIFQLFNLVYTIVFAEKASGKRIVLKVQRKNPLSVCFICDRHLSEEPT